MAGLPRTTITFHAERPRLEVIASAVERRGGLATCTNMESGSLRLCFACRRKEEVEIAAGVLHDGTIDVTDWSMKGGALYQLVCETLVELGGKCELDWGASLCLPLTEASLKREHLRIAISGLVVTTILIGIVAAVLGGLGYLGWKVMASAI